MAALQRIPLELAPETQGPGSAAVGLHLDGIKRQVTYCTRDGLIRQTLLGHSPSGGEPWTLLQDGTCVEYAHFPSPSICALSTTRGPTSSIRMFRLDRSPVHLGTVSGCSPDAGHFRLLATGDALCGVSTRSTVCIWDVCTGSITFEARQIFPERQFYAVSEAGNELLVASSSSSQAVLERKGSSAPHGTTLEVRYFQLAATGQYVQVRQVRMETEPLAAPWFSGDRVTAEIPTRLGICRWVYDCGRIDDGSSTFARVAPLPYQGRVSSFFPGPPGSNLIAAILDDSLVIMDSDFSPVALSDQLEVLPRVLVWSSDGTLVGGLDLTIPLVQVWSIDR